MATNEVRKKIVIKMRPVGQVGPQSPPSKNDLLKMNPDRSLWSIIVEQNTFDKQIVGKCVRREIDPKKFKEYASERSIRQWTWGTASYNIRHPKYLCKNNCTYCYMGPMFKRFGHECTQVDIEDIMPTDPKQVNKRWTKVTDSSRKEMYFFPSSSDIFYENMEEYVVVAKKIIDAGHEIMFVTKPTIRSMTKFDEVFKQLPPMYKSKLYIYVTITTNLDEISDMFEPNTSKYTERLQVIRFLMDNHYNVNVMMEPYLSDPIPMISELSLILNSSVNYGNNSSIIAVGKMNYSKSMTFSEDSERNRKIVAYLENLYNPKTYMPLWKFIEPLPNIFLKPESIKELLKV